MQTYSRGKLIYDSALQLQIWITVIGVVIAIIIGIIVALSIIIPLQQLRNTTDLLAQGDLSARVNIKSNDEVGAVAIAFNRALDELQLMVTQAAKNAINITFSSDELFRVTNETSRSLGELNHLVADLASGATSQTRTVESAIQIVQKATEGADSVNQATIAINNTCKEASLPPNAGVKLPAK